MQRLWSADELGERWSLLAEDLALLAGRVDAGKLGFAIQLAFWRQHGRFPDDEAEVAPAVVAHLAAQIGVGADALDGYAWAGRSGRRHRVAIIDHLAIAAFDEAAEARFRRWLTNDALPREFAAPALDEELSAWFARSRVTRPGAYRLGRIMRSAQAAHDDAALQQVAERLDAGMRERLGALLADDGDGTAYARLAADPGRVGLESLLAEIAKLERLRALALPSDLLRGLHPDQAKRFRRRAAVESAWELRRHPDRDAQFAHIARSTTAALAEGQPVISVDTKKKELVGPFRNPGREWRPQGAPEQVRVHDFLIGELGRAVPYGVYDLAANAGWVSVGMDYDTAEFAVQTIRRWWQDVGQPRYPHARKLTITADGGGSNGSRVRLWKRELQRLANELGLGIAVHHLPPGTSKWNKVEHRLFSYISQNWRAKPLVSYRTIVELIGATTTKTGLSVRCELDQRAYSKGIRVSDEDMAALNIHHDPFHGEWNYTIKPQKPEDDAVVL